MFDASDIHRQWRRLRQWRQVPDLHQPAGGGVHRPRRLRRDLAHGDEAAEVRPRGCRRRGHQPSARGSLRGPPFPDSRRAVQPAIEEAGRVRSQGYRGPTARSHGLSLSRFRCRATPLRGGSTRARRRGRIGVGRAAPPLQLGGGPRQRAPALAVNAVLDGSCFGYSGDTSWTPALVTAAEGTDVFACEAYTFDRAVPYHLDYATVRQHIDELARAESS
jgi:hypothetical protein